MDVHTEVYTENLKDVNQKKWLAHPQFFLARGQIKSPQFLPPMQHFNHKSAREAKFPAKNLIDGQIEKLYIDFSHEGTKGSKTLFFVAFIFVRNA